MFQYTVLRIAALTPLCSIPSSFSHSRRPRKCHIQPSSHSRIHSKL